MKDLRDKIDNYSFMCWLKDNRWQPVMGFEWKNTKTGKTNMVGDLIIDYLEAGAPIEPTFTKYAGTRSVEFEIEDYNTESRNKIKKELNRINNLPKPLR